MKQIKEIMPFDISLIDEYDIETNEGYSVQILKEDFNNKYFPILGVITYPDHDEVRLFTKLGESDIDGETVRMYKYIPEYPNNYDNITEPSKEYKESDLTWEMTPIEYERYKAFSKDHLHKDVYVGAIGVGPSVIFGPTSIGNTVSCKCPICNTEANITDYGSF